jgi:hypothetical protein
MANALRNGDATPWLPLAGDSVENQTWEYEWGQWKVVWTDGGKLGVAEESQGLRNKAWRLICTLNDELWEMSRKYAWDGVRIISLMNI